MWPGAAGFTLFLPLAVGPVAVAGSGLPSSHPRPSSKPSTLARSFAVECIRQTWPLLPYLRTHAARACSEQLVHCFLTTPSFTAFGRLCLTRLTASQLRSASVSAVSPTPARQLAGFRLPSAGCRCHSSHLDDSSPPYTRHSPLRSLIYFVRPSAAQVGLCIPAFSTLIRPKSGRGPRPPSSSPLLASL